MAPITLQQLFCSLAASPVHIYFGEGDLVGISLPAAEAQLWRLDGKIDYIFSEAGCVAVRVLPGTLHADLEDGRELDRFEKAMLAIYGGSERQKDRSR